MAMANDITTSMRSAVTESLPTRLLLIGIALVFLALFLILPVVAVFVEAFRKGTEEYLTALVEPDAWAAIRLTLLVAAISVPVNLVFGVAAAWAIAKFEFKGKAVLTTLIDLPFSISPVISGLVFVLLFASHGLLGPWLSSHNIQILFAVPGIVLATLFVTFPFVARELIPLMQEQGSGDEEAAISLGQMAGKPSVMSPCPTSNGGFSTAFCSVMRGRWASLAQFLWCRAIFVVLPIQCRCMSKSSTMSTISSQHLPSPHCWHFLLS